MKSLVFFALLLVAAVAFPQKSKYTTKYDNIDLDQILNSDRLLNNYVNCLMEVGKCTPDALELKDNLSDAIKNECAGCSQKQKDGSKKVLTFLFDNKPETFKRLEAKYDSEGAFRKRIGRRDKQ